jgi:acetylornithine deacetylase/succinyl-diaminopimelate desuccinylase-like protein
MLIDELAAYPDLLEAAQKLDRTNSRFAERSIAIQQIAAPTGAEGQRARWIEREFRDLGLHDVEQDPIFNVYGRIAGKTRGPAVLVTAHTDTVFAAATDLTVATDEAQDRISGPGIGDNSAGVAGLLAIAEICSRLTKPPVDIWFVANTGEEGLGDLKGMRAVVDRLQERIGACIVVEGMGLGRVVHRALGSKRFRMSVTAPGGHSWSDFGSASAIHILVAIAAQLAALLPPDSPRTTYNIGRIEGGTSINTIAQHAALELDLRSEETGALAQIVQQALDRIQPYQTVKYQRQGVEVLVETIGDRPPGQIDRNHPLVQAALDSLGAAGWSGALDLRISSTDANIPLSRGIPAVCVGITEGGNAHRRQEWIEVEPAMIGLRHLLYLVWWTAVWLGGKAGSPA